MAKPSDLLPCPCCGSPANVNRDHRRDASETWIACTRCPMGTSRRSWLGSDEAIVDALVFDWNRRASPAGAREIDAATPEGAQEVVTVTPDTLAKATAIIMATFSKSYASSSFLNDLKLALGTFNPLLMANGQPIPPDFWLCEGMGAASVVSNDQKKNGGIYGNYDAHTVPLWRAIYTHPARDAEDAARYRFLREGSRDLADLLQLVVGLNPNGRGTWITALRHTANLDSAIDAARAGEEVECGQ